MELYIYDRDMILHGVIDEINSLIWTRRYWSAGEFKLLVPFTSKHVSLLVKNNLIMKRGDTEAAEIRYVHISKNSQGLEEIEVQGSLSRNGSGSALYAIRSPQRAGRRIFYTGLSAKRSFPRKWPPARSRMS